MSQSDPLEQLVADYIELRERDASITPTIFARTHPAHAEALLAALAALEQTESLLPLESSRDLPETVGPYRVLGELGRGGIGRVLLVASPGEPGRELALKLLHPLCALDPRSLERFRREGEVLKALEHPGIVRVHASGVVGTSPYLVMDRVRGVNLAEIVRAARARPALRGSSRAERLELPGTGPAHERVARLVAQLARAIACVHAAGALHRDVKPANVILRADGSPVLVDFGMVHQGDGATLTRTGDLLGTPQYMPPEQARGERTDERGDVYGLGCLLYELLTLQAPHEGDSALEVLARVRSRPVRRLRSIAPEIPRELELVAQRALAHRPARRTSSAEDLARDLEAFLEGRPIRAAAPSPLERAQDLWSFHRSALVALALALLLAAGALLYRERWITQRLALAQASYQSAILAWIEGDAAAAESAALASLRHRGGQAWVEFLLALVAPRPPSLPRRADVEAAAAGWAAHESGEHARAVLEFARAADLAPGEVLAVLLLGREAAHAGDHARAQRELSAALRILPASSRLQEELGTSFYASGDFEQASVAFEAALKLAPQRAGLWEELARTRYRLGRFEEGLAAAQRAQELAGEKPTFRILNTHGALLDVNRRHAEARALFEQAQKLAPDASSPAMGIASTLDSEHRAREAQDAYWHAAQVGPPGKPLIHLAFLYAGARSSECEDCRRVYRESPDLLDPGRAEFCALGALDADGGREPALPQTAALVARQIGRPERIRAKLEELKACAERDELIVRYERALRMLRKE